jgi:hypothetical protein
MLAVDLSYIAFIMVHSPMTFFHDFLVLVNLCAFSLLVMCCQLILGEEKFLCTYPRNTYPGPFSMCRLWALTLVLTELHQRALRLGWCSSQCSSSEVSCRLPDSFSSSSSYCLRVSYTMSWVISILSSFNTSSKHYNKHSQIVYFKFSSLNCAYFVLWRTQACICRILLSPLLCWLTCVPQLVSPCEFLPFSYRKSPTWVPDDFWELE